MRCSAWYLPVVTFICAVGLAHKLALAKESRSRLMLRQWLIAGFGIAAAAVVLVGGYEWMVRPATYRDAVTEALAQRGVAYSDVQVREICLPDPSCVITDPTRNFEAVVVRRDSASYGQITCYDRRGDCYLDLPTLGIFRVPLRDLHGVRILPKSVARIVEQIAALLR
jgi:hypothetical protein